LARATLAEGLAPQQALEYRMPPADTVAEYKGRLAQGQWKEPDLASGAADSAGWFNRGHKFE